VSSAPLGRVRTCSAIASVHRFHRFGVGLRLGVQRFAAIVLQKHVVAFHACGRERLRSGDHACPLAELGRELIATRGVGRDHGDGAGERDLDQPRGRSGWQIGGPAVLKHRVAVHETDDGRVVGRGVGARCPQAVPVAEGDPEDRRVRQHRSPVLDPHREDPDGVACPEGEQKPLHGALDVQPLLGGDGVPNQLQGVQPRAPGLPGRRSALLTRQQR
jgi:hypothetical protein